MEVSTHNNERLRPNGLISPALTPVTEEPPPLTGTNVALDESSAVDGETASDSTRLDVDALVTKRDRAYSSPVQTISQQFSSLLGRSVNHNAVQEDVLKLSPAQSHELISEPTSLPTLGSSLSSLEAPSIPHTTQADSNHGSFESEIELGQDGAELRQRSLTKTVVKSKHPAAHQLRRLASEFTVSRPQTKQVTEGKDVKASRPSPLPRSLSVPFPLAKQLSGPERIKPKRLQSKSVTAAETETKAPMSRSNSQDKTQYLKTLPLPLPPLSIPTHLHLELSADRPSSLYIHRTQSTSIPYESSRVKFERLLNFLLLPPQLEQVLLFGALTCLDAWLYIFTILPLRFLKAVWILLYWTARSLISEIFELPSYVFRGIGRLWRPRHRGRSAPNPKGNSTETAAAAQDQSVAEPQHAGPNGTLPNKAQMRSRIHERPNRDQPKTPSSLQAGHKADLLQGLIIIFSCVFLMRFDASRMYHAIRGQAAIKLYVIYNVLEVCDRLFSALGQDIMDCLFSSETLDRKPNGRSRIIRPFWMFLLALAYTVFHSMAFFYQVITLNVAVNSYSNALLTLLMSNQFVEIKGTVFKKIEKENLFQLTCADIVERFQLWLMLLVIAMRNIVELGGFSASSSDFAGPSSSASAFSNSTTGVPFRTFGILPQSFTLLPSSFPAQVFGPFLIVLGSEMLVDWLKHAYISKFNAVTPGVYGRFLDVLAKDYYSNAFAEQNLTRRLGLPVIPLACLFIRASLQTYHMFLATNVSIPLVATTTTSLSLESKATSSPVIAQIDHIFRTALGRSSLGADTYATSGIAGWATWTLDDLIALTTMLVFFLALYLLLLVIKLSLGMILLRFSRDRYRNMKRREKQSFVETESKRLGGWGAVELGDERRKVIYEGDPAGLKAMREREAKMKEVETKAKAGDRLDSVDRYSMVAKRIW